MCGKEKKERIQMYYLRQKKKKEKAVISYFLLSEKS